MCKKFHNLQIIVCIPREFTNLILLDDTLKTIGTRALRERENSVDYE